MRNAMMIGARVYLRPAETGDADVFARFDAEETETFMYRGRSPFSPLGYAHWITEVHKQQPPRWIEFSVCLTENDRLIGHVGVDGIDYVNRTGETGSMIGVPEYRGQGYGTEAKHLLLEYCFDRLQLHVLSSFVAETNPRSAAALAKQGYRAAGRLKWWDVKGGIYRDMLVFDLTRDAWLAARRAMRNAQ